MARLPARVGWIIHDRMRTKVALRLAKSSMTFQAEWAGKVYRNKDGAVLRKQILELIEASEHLVFHPVIEAEVARPGYGSYSSGRRAQVSLCVDRFFYAESSSGGLLKLAWERQDSSRQRHWNPGEGFTGVPCHIPHCYSYDPDRHYLVYSDDMWAGLGVLLDAIEQAEGRINEILSADDTLARIEAVGAAIIKALPAPKENEDE